MQARLPLHRPGARKMCWATPDTFERSALFGRAQGLGFPDPNPKPKSLFRRAQVSSRGWEELLFVALHYVWYLGIVFGALPWPKALLFVLLSQMFSGFLLSIVFVQVRLCSAVLCCG
jgi:hypothetical protein